MGQLEKYLGPTPTIDSNSESIKQTAQNLTKGQEEVINKATSLFHFVKDDTAGELSDEPLSPH